jgi:SAM-dependent methyltransferase
VIAATALNHDDDALAAVVCCPRCAGRLIAGASFRCTGCGQAYPVTDGIPQLFAPNEWSVGTLDVTEIVKAFYEETPFPNYDDLDSRDSLRAKAAESVFARLLDEQIKRDALVLEAGCGTGQLTNYLGMAWHRRVVGADLCMNSLRLARGFRDRFGIINAEFVQMNLFRPPFADGSFDLVVSNGVLHHTANPEAGFRALAAKVKPGGHIIIGLYNWLARLPTLWRRRAIESFGTRMAALDRRLRGSVLNSERWNAWFRDQYQHPHESRHSMTEVLGWFERAGFAFTSSVPLIGDREFGDDVRLFETSPAGSAFDRAVTELAMLLEGGLDGGLYIMMGRKVARP